MERACMTLHARDPPRVSGNFKIELIVMKAWMSDEGVVQAVVIKALY